MVMRLFRSEVPGERKLRILQQRKRLVGDRFLVLQTGLLPFDEPEGGVLTGPSTDAGRAGFTPMRPNS
ncbi:hypothetical protein [Cohnella thermotolerans]|uniref:hypothetical protein n=1 Tax=Cohnella thermotolerans TaxID=329858 RepID=UPI00047EBB6C|nr:hypothetical protein [Cohnella thermotolerans]